MDFKDDYWFASSGIFSLCCVRREKLRKTWCILKGFRTKSLLTRRLMDISSHRVVAKNEFSHQRKVLLNVECVFSHFGPTDIQWTTKY